MSDWVWVAALIVPVAALRVWSIVRFNRAVAELARRPEREFRVAGIDRVAELHRTGLLGMGARRMRRIRRRLDRAAVEIARSDQGHGPDDSG